MRCGSKVSRVQLRIANLCPVSCGRLAGVFSASKHTFLTATNPMERPKLGEIQQSSQGLVSVRWTQILSTRRQPEHFTASAQRPFSSAGVHKLWSNSHSSAGTGTSLLGHSLGQSPPVGLALWSFFGALVENRAALVPPGTPQLGSPRASPPSHVGWHFHPGTFSILYLGMLLKLTPSLGRPRKCPVS